jgi:hypothetical protein
MPDALQELIATIERVKCLTDTSVNYSMLSKARALPATYVGAASGLRIAHDSVYGGRAAAMQEELAKKLAERMSAEERARGERERDILLSKYSAELESLRAILPSLAAKAAVEIGMIARALADEARSGVR